jgi:organic radical activating enzyme
MQVEWEITMKCNYGCFYCTNLDKSIYPNLDRDTIRNFVKMLGETYPGVEVFVFGGEPFVHPDIEYIIQCFNEFNVPFVIQTNLSSYSAKVIKGIKQPFTMQASIHPSEMSIEELNEVLGTPHNVRRFDVMYSQENALYYYFKVQELTKSKHVYLTPITDFGDGVSDTVLAKFNELKNNPQLRNIIQFEDEKRLGQSRSELWADIKFSTKGKPCLYKDKYFLYGPNLELYNCCYRIKTDGICPKNKCFLM